MKVTNAVASPTKISTEVTQKKREKHRRHPGNNVSFTCRTATVVLRSAIRSVCQPGFNPIEKPNFLCMHTLEPFVSIEIVIFHPPKGLLPLSSFQPAVIAGAIPGAARKPSRLFRAPSKLG